MLLVWTVLLGGVDGGVVLVIVGEGRMGKDERRLVVKTEWKKVEYRLSYGQFGDEGGWFGEEDGQGDNSNDLGGRLSR